MSGSRRGLRPRRSETSGSPVLRSRGCSPGGFSVHWSPTVCSSPSLPNCKGAKPQQNGEFCLIRARRELQAPQGGTKLPLLFNSGACALRKSQGVRSSAELRREQPRALFGRVSAPGEKAAAQPKAAARRRFAPSAPVRGNASPG